MLKHSGGDADEDNRFSSADVDGSCCFKRRERASDLDGEERKGRAKENGSVVRD